MAPRFEDLLSDVLALEDPVDRFRKLGDLANGELSSLIRAERVRIVRELRAQEPRPTWAELGELLGISGQRVRELNEHTAPTTPKETAQP